MTGQCNNEALFQNLLHHLYTCSSQSSDRHTGCWEFWTYKKKKVALIAVIFTMCHESVLRLRLFNCLENFKTSCGMHRNTFSFCALWSPHKSTIQTQEQLEFARWLPHRHYCATWTLKSTTYAKETGNLAHALTDFKFSQTTNPKISVLCQYHWTSNVLMLFNYTIVLSAGVWTSSTYDWHHSSWVFLTSQRYYIVPDTALHHTMQYVFWVLAVINVYSFVLLF